MHDALLAYWTERDEAARRHSATARQLDNGERSTATSGVHLDRIAQLLGKVCLMAGVPVEDLYYKAPKGDPVAEQPRRLGAISRGYTLPGYYRPTKQWDLVVHHRNVPVIVIELKSQNGPSYSNNANNRVEEAIGSAVDLAAARAAGLIPGDPWLGYVFVIEDDLDSNTRDRDVQESVFPIHEDFEDWTYVRRVAMLGRRLIDMRHYDAAWVVATSRPDCPQTDKRKCPQLKRSRTPHVHEFGWNEPESELLGYAHFVNSLAEQLGRYFTPGLRPLPAQTLF